MFCYSCYKSSSEDDLNLFVRLIPIFSWINLRAGIFSLKMSADRFSTYISVSYLASSQVALTSDTELETSKGSDRSVIDTAFFSRFHYSNGFKR